MKFAFLIFKYFPYGGLQRDMLRMATQLVDLGHDVEIYTISWQGEMPVKNIGVRVVPTRGLRNYIRYDNFIKRAQAAIAGNGFDLIVGFNRMAGLDVYFAGDPCFAEKMHARRRSLMPMLAGKNRWFAACERAVFAVDSKTEILSLSEREKQVFQRWYGTPDERFHPILPFLSGKRLALVDKASVRQRVRQELGFGPDDYLILLVGSGFRMKGLDRAIEAVAALPAEIKCKTRLIGVGQDNPKAFNRLVSVLRLTPHVQLHPGRDDIPALMQAADLLVHPARRELAGHVLLEAMASGLPVLASGACGFGFHVTRANAGVVLPEPYRQSDLNRQMAAMLVSVERETWSRNGLEYARMLMSANDGGADARLLVMLAERKRELAGGMSEDTHAVM